MLEVKANALEESFDAVLQADRMTGIEARMDALDATMKAQAERAGRPPLDGAKGGEVDPARAAFTERYLRRGIEAGVELKSFSGATPGSGGYAVPREIDQMIEVALKAISPTGADAGWRRAALFRYRAESEAAEPIGPTAPRAVMGRALTGLTPGEPWRIDRRGTVDIVLDNEVDALVSVEDDALLDGANLCQIGEELLQFGMAQPIGPRTYRLSRLVRGRQGTEWATSDHAADERFVLIDPARLASVQADPSDVGRVLDLRAVGSGDAVPAEAARLIDGRAMLPPSPVHGRAVALAGGDLSLSWVRRSRLGWGWADEGEVPLGEEREAYLLRVTAGGLLLREWEVPGMTALYAGADLAADTVEAGPAALIVEIRQIGTWGLSRPLLLPLS